MTHAEEQHLRQAFDAAMAYFSLPPEVRRIAWEQSKRSRQLRGASKWTI